MKRQSKLRLVGFMKPNSRRPATAGDSAKGDEEKKKPLFLKRHSRVWWLKNYQHKKIQEHLERKMQPPLSRYNLQTEITRPEGAKKKTSVVTAEITACRDQYNCGGGKRKCLAGFAEVLAGKKELAPRLRPACFELFYLFST